MNYSLRTGTSSDSTVTGRICYEAFRTISSRHSFPEDFPDPETASGFTGMLFSRPDVFSVIAEAEGRVVGSNFLWEGDDVAGVGPITVDPDVQNSRIGRGLMQAVIDRAEERAFPSVRLVQAAYHNRSLSLYLKLGFDVVESLSTMQGAPLNIRIEGLNVRPMVDDDIDACDRLCFSVHGHRRTGELESAIARGTGRVVERGDGSITGYTTGVGFFGHSVGEANDDLKALIGSATEFPGPGFLLPTRNNYLMRWCLENGLRIVQPMTLMSKGIYQKPRGAFLPSVLF